MKKLFVSMGLLLTAGVLAGCTHNPELNINGNADVSTNMNENNIGTMVNAQGDVVYRGEIEDNMQHGSGTSYDDEGNMLYAGMRVDGEAEGQGKLFYANGQVAYEGEWEDGEPEGEGTWFYSNGQIAYEGTFDNGNPSEEGTLYDIQGNVLFEGEFGNAIDMWPQGSGMMDSRVNRQAVTNGFIDASGKLHVEQLFYGTSSSAQREMNNSVEGSSSASADVMNSSMLRVGGDDSRSGVQIQMDNQADADADTSVSSDGTVQNNQMNNDSSLQGGGSMGNEGSASADIDLEGLLR